LKKRLNLFFAKRRMDLAYLPLKPGNEWVILATDPRVIDLAQQDGFDVLRLEKLSNREDCWEYFIKAIDTAKQVFCCPDWALHRGINIGEALLNTQSFYEIFLLAGYFHNAIKECGGVLAFVEDGSPEAAIARIIGGELNGFQPFRRHRLIEVAYVIKRGRVDLDIRMAITNGILGLFPSVEASAFLPVINRIPELERRSDRRLGRNKDVLFNIFGSSYRYLSHTMKMLKDAELGVAALVMDIDDRPPRIKALLEDNFPCFSLADFAPSDPVGRFREYQELWARLQPNPEELTRHWFEFQGIDLSPAFFRLIQEAFSYHYPRLALSTDAICNIFDAHQFRVLVSMEVLQREDYILSAVAKRSGTVTLAVRHGIGGTIHATVQMARENIVAMESAPMADAMVSAGIPEDMMIAPGSLYADEVLSHTFLSRRRLEKTIEVVRRPYILYAPQPFSIQGYSFAIPREKVASVCHRLKLPDGYILVIKLHRIDSEQRYDYLERQKDIYFTRDVDILNLMQHCEAMIMEYGSEVPEALLVDIDIPIVLFDPDGFAAWTHRKRYNPVDYREDGAFAVVERVEDIESALEKEIKQRGDRRAQRIAFIHKVAGKPDGLSWQRLGREIISLID